MKILHVIHSLDPRTGGPAEVIRGLVRGQTGAGHCVTVLATTVQFSEPWKDGDVYRKTLEEDVALADCELCLADAWGRRRPWSALGFSWSARRWLRRRFRDPQSAPEVIHIHGLFADITAYAARAAYRRGIPYVLRPAGVLNVRCLEMGSRRWKKLFARYLLRGPLAHAACLHATSENEAAELRRWTPDHLIRVIPHGVDVPDDRDLQRSADSFLRTCPQVAGCRILLYLGRIAEKKRPQMLVEALARLRPEFPDLVLLLAGQDDGGMPAVAEATRAYNLADAVVHAGFLQGDMKRGALAAASVFALPSIDENFGVAVIEALAHGTPALVTPGVGAHIYVDQSGGGLTVDGNADALADGLRKLLSADRADVGGRGRAFVQQQLGWPAILAQIERLYREIIEKDRARSPTAMRRS